MKMLSILIIVSLLISSIPAFAFETVKNPNVGLNVPAVGRWVEIPAEVQVVAIYSGATGENLAWKDIRRFGKEKLIELLQSPWTRVTGKIYEKGVYRPLTRKELLKIIKAEGYEKAPVSAKSRKGSFKTTRTMMKDSLDIGKCISVFVAGPNENIPRRTFERLSEKEKLQILSHPRTKRYLERCK